MISTLKLLVMPKSKISSLFDDSRSRQESDLMEHPPFRGPRRPGRTKSDGNLTKSNALTIKV